MADQGIKPAVLAELQRQLNHELAAAHEYAAVSLWCEHQDFKGFARYFHKQSVEERAHARRFMDHLLDRGVLPRLAQLPAPDVQLETLLDVARQAQSMEQANTTGIHSAYEAALREKDYAAQILLQWFITEQVEEEDWTAEMINRVERANCAGGLAELDRHIERYLTQKVVEDGGE